MRLNFPLLLLASAAFVVAAFLVFAKPYVKDAYLAFVPPDMGMVLFTFVNPSPRPVCIVEISVDGRPAELHKTEFNGTHAAMVPVDKVCAGPFSTLQFTTLGYHVMFYGNVSRVADVMLRLDDGSAISFVAELREAGGVHVH